jgi:uncharacterized protein YndB with AHSA1/START domain
VKEQIKLNIFYPHPPEKVWQALTDCRILNTWMMSNNFKPCLGHKFKFEGEGCGGFLRIPNRVVESNSLPGIKTIIHCEVVELEKPKRLAYTWQDEITREPSLVIWKLNPVEGGTQIQLSHQQIGYATTVISSIDTNLKPINISPGLFLYEQPKNNFNQQIPYTSSVQIVAREELNSLINHKDSKEEWNYRLNYQLPKALQSQIKST